jgi:hypothetical protein
MRYSDLTILKQSYVDYCVGYSQFRIRESMSISEISCDVETYDQLRLEVALEPHGYADMEMVEIGRELFGGDEEYVNVCRLIESILDGWLRTTPPMPLHEITFPPAD